MKRNGQLVRVLHLIGALLNSRFGVTLKDLLLDYPCTQRTFYRDLGAIQDAGLPLQRERRITGEIAYRVQRLPHDLRCHRPMDK